MEAWSYKGSSLLLHKENLPENKVNTVDNRVERWRGTESPVTLLSQFVLGFCAI